MFLSSEPGKTYLFKFCTDSIFGETSMLDIGRGYDGWVGWGEGMVPERRQEHVPYLPGNAVY